MPTLVATLRVKKDKVDEAKSFLKELAAEVLANEEGTLEYSLFQKQDEPEVFVLYERYASPEALAVHGKNLAAKGAGFAGILDGRPDIMQLTSV